MTVIIDSRWSLPSNVLIGGGNDGSGMDSGACPGHRSGFRRNDINVGSIQFCKVSPYYVANIFY